MTHAVTTPTGIDIARTSRDIRVISAALAANSAVIRPATITATGREAPSRHAIIPGSFPASFALLPYIDYVDDPAVRPGCGFVGGRHSSIVPYLRPADIPTPVDLRVELKHLPASREEIRLRLRETSGLWWAPGALFALVGWEDDWVAVLADHLRENGPAAMLAIALAQAQYAHRKMWLRAGHDVGAPPANLASWWPSLSTQAGTVATGRALIDVATMLIALVNETVAAGESVASVPRVLQKIKVLLGQFVHYAAKAERRPDTKARGTLMKAAGAARTLLDAVAIFSVGPEALGRRWQRLDAELAGVAITTDPGTLRLADLVAFETDLNRLDAADLGSRLERTTWRNHIRRSLLRLANPRLADRIVLLHRVRADLLYKLAMTGRLDRLYELFPWLAAPHGAFVGCAGGAIGALASLVEAGRRLDIGREQLHELVEAADDHGVERQRAAVRRLTVPVAKSFWRSQIQMAAAAGHGFVAGMALDHGAFSHATVSAVMNGAYFGLDYPITAARFGKLGWRLPVALQDPRTVAAVQAVEQGRQVLRSKDHDNDLPRCNGMTLRRQLAEMILWVFPTRPAGRNEPQRRARAEDAAVRAGRRSRDSTPTANTAMNEILRSMLVSLERPIDEIYRDAIADDTVPVELLMGEAGAQAAEQSKATRTSIVIDEAEVGQGTRRQAMKERSLTDDRYALLRDLAHEAALWREPRRRVVNPRKTNGKPPPVRNTNPPRDELLKEILRRRADLDTLTPIGALPCPLLWFAPMIDRERIGWIARGAPVGHAPTGSSTHRDGIALQVARAHAWAPLLFSKSLPVGHSIDVACTLFTGRSPTTADLELAYNSRR